MKYSHFFGKTVKTVAADEKIISNKLLTQAGFIRESTAGRLFMLPLGQKVQQNIIKIVKEEMDAAGAQEMLVPVLHPLELWQETNRTNTTGFELMKITDRRGAEFALGGTAEEMFVDVVRKFNLSYRDLPFHIYQFSLKFRDEMRARGGLLRVREFIMKDSYSFDRDAEEFAKTYELMKTVYTRIFERLGLKTYIVEADNGYIGGEYCHEFIVESEVGESRFFVTEDGSYAAHEDVARFRRNPANATAEMLPLEHIEQPAWVRDMDENAKHYGLPKNHYLKNVVYRHRVTKEIIIAVVTGDLEVNKTKLEQAIGAVGQLEAATDEDLAALGTKSGYVHSWGHKARYIGDIVLESARNLIGGQKEESTDTKNVNYGRDFTCEKLADIALAQTGDIEERTGQPLVEKKGIEVGNIFQLGYHYTKLMKGANFTNAEGEEKPYYMGCYGIGIGRTMAAVVEVTADERGMKWPESITPYQIHLVGLDLQDESVKSKVLKVYKELCEKSPNQVLFDDREEARAGEKFADADLIGCPIRVVVSKKTGDMVEVKRRGEKEFQLMSLEDFIGQNTK